jgi:hypothetical protein
MAVRLSAWWVGWSLPRPFFLYLQFFLSQKKKKRACHLLPLERLLVIISVRGCVDPRATVRLEGLGQLKIQWPHWDCQEIPGLLWNPNFHYYVHKSVLVVSTPSHLIKKSTHWYPVFNHFLILPYFLDLHILDVSFCIYELWCWICTICSMRHDLSNNFDGLSPLRQLKLSTGLTALSLWLVITRVWNPLSAIFQYWMPYTDSPMCRHNRDNAHRTWST